MLGTMNALHEFVKESTCSKGTEMKRIISAVWGDNNEPDRCGH